jgi:hypothetical protein
MCDRYNHQNLTLKLTLVWWKGNVNVWYKKWDINIADIFLKTAESSLTRTPRISSICTTFLCIIVTKLDKFDPVTRSMIDLVNVDLVMWLLMHRPKYSTLYTIFARKCLDTYMCAVYRQKIRYVCCVLTQYFLICLKVTDYDILVIVHCVTLALNIRFTNICRNTHRGRQFLSINIIKIYWYHYQLCEYYTV